MRYGIFLNQLSNKKLLAPIIFLGAVVGGYSLVIAFAL